MEKDDKDSAKVSKFIFSKGVIDSDLFKHHGVNELLNYINNKDVELDKVQILVRKANRELKIHGRRLFIRKLLGRDKETENLICITRR